MRTGLAWVIAAAVAVSTPGCGAARPLVLDSAAPPAAGAGRDERAVATILADVRGALEEELGEPAPAVRLVLHADRESFARGLAAEGLDPGLSRASAQTMDGIGGPGWVHVHGPALYALSRRDRIAMLAHEVVHVLQYAWADGRRGASDQWLREGFAEWLTGRVMVRLGLVAPQEWDRRLEALRRSVSSVQRPPLTRLRRFPDWLRWVEATRGPEAYDVVAVAVQRLIERRGVAAVVDYFRRFAARDDADAVFLDVFGTTVDDFDRDVRAWMRGAPARR